MNDERRMIAESGEEVAAPPEDKDLDDMWGLYGRVAKVVDKKRVIAALGAEDGVTETDQFWIATFGGMVTDGDERLGQITYKKARLRVEDIDEQLTVLRCVEARSGEPYTVHRGDWVYRIDDDDSLH